LLSQFPVKQAFNMELSADSQSPGVRIKSPVPKCI